MNPNKLPNPFREASSQQDFFGPIIRQGQSIVPPYQRHSETSRQAAIEAAPSAPTQRDRVLAYLKRCGPYGATDEEIQRDLALNPSTERPRRVELWKMGKIKLTERKRRTVFGRMAAVWKIAS